jgi:hypothetical protein
VIIFGSVRFGFYQKKATKPVLKKTKTGWFGYFRTKTGSKRFFLGCLDFFQFGFGLIFLISNL